MHCEGGALATRMAHSREKVRDFKALHGKKVRGAKVVAAV
jgi:hypothetical protein